MGISWSAQKVNATFHTNMTEIEVSNFIDTRYLYCRDDGGRVWKATNVQVDENGVMKIEMSIVNEEIPNVQ